MRGWKSVFIIFVVALFSSSVLAANVNPKGGGSGDSPTPFKNTNQRVELADGESYSLVGQVIFWRGNAYFEVDLKEHPWLANKKRIARPYYEIEGSVSYLKRFDRVRIKFFAEARSVIRQDDSREGEYYPEIILSPLADPVIFTPTQCKKPRFNQE
jgi:hypothetical protein